MIVKSWMVKTLRSFSYALSGLRWAIATQRNLKIHCVAATLAVGAGLIQNIAAWKWCVLILCIALVWATELLNTALETLCDRITLEPDELIRRAKDTAAAAVLVVSIAALIIGLVILT